MVELVVWDFEEESDLELMLQEANIEYQLCLNMGHCGIKPPYLVVHLKIYTIFGRLA